MVKKLLILLLTVLILVVIYGLAFIFKMDVYDLLSVITFCLLIEHLAAKHE